MRNGTNKAEVVVVTGATSGVGRAIARAFAAEGAAVALLGRSPEGLDGARKDVESAGARALAIPTDVGDVDRVEAAAALVEETLGPIDVWVNNAMTTIFAPFEEVEPDEFRRATAVTYLGTVWGTRAALARMVPRDRGSVIQVGSAMAYRGIPLQAPYCGAKHAIKGFTDSVVTELLHKGSDVHVGMVQLPGLNTPQFDHCRSKMPNHPMPVPPIYQPEVAARAVVSCTRRRRREMYVGIPTLYTIWGNRLAPWLVDRYLAKTAVSGQQTEEPIDAPRPGNLFEPVEGDPGAHGDFDDSAHGRSIQLWASEHRGVVAAVTAAAIAGAGAAIGRSGS
jgi:NAD(P)-dependent dehydrogenase (short-subunit alcohol dehydrogenase family)